jgi:hypothetical protein
MEVKCENCKYWDQVGMGIDDDGLGECKRFPPVLSDQIYKKQLAANNDVEEARWIATVYPLTGVHDNCGEWKAKG